MKQRLTGLLLYCLFPFLLYAQKQGNIWYFGQGAGINFNATPPVALTDGALYTNEGCASICDDNGNILFYTDGITVFNKQHQVMVNGTGLLGHKSASQSAVIVPWPEKNNLYYIITCDALENSLANGYNYSIVDINKAGGLGEVVEKNKLLYTPSTEKLVVVRHANGVDWWVITRQWGNNQFKAYLIDKTGISVSPIISSVGFKGIAFPYNATGGMKISPDNKKLAVAYWNVVDAGSYIELFDFDNSTGILSNLIKLDDQYAFGVAFSPDSKLLYVSNEWNSIPRIDQFDISTATDAASLEATRITITPNNYTKFSKDLQLGTDNKLYINNDNEIAVINLPNNRGSSCNLQENVINLKGRSGSLMFPSVIVSPLALPPSFDINASIVITDPCKREVQLSASSNQMSNITYKWELGNATSSSLKEPKTFYPFSKDVFDITLEVTADIPTGSWPQQQTKSITKQVTFNALPEAHAGSDIIAVAGRPFQLHATGGSQYEWSPILPLNDPMIANPIATLYTDQTFTLKAFNADGCVDDDQVHVKVYKEEMIHVPTGFTPNGDGKNDILNIFPIGVKLEYFSIYNRWGNLVFKTKDNLKGWNGLYNGKEQPNGTYTWIAKSIGSNGQPIIQKGVLTLIR